MPAFAASGMATVAEKSPSLLATARPTTMGVEWKVTVTAAPGLNPWPETVTRSPRCK